MREALLHARRCAPAPSRDEYAWGDEDDEDDEDDDEAAGDDEEDIMDDETEEEGELGKPAARGRGGAAGALVVELLLDQRWVLRHGSPARRQYLVRWEGHDATHDTWEDEAPRRTVGSRPARGRSGASRGLAAPAPPHCHTFRHPEKAPPCPRHSGLCPR